MVDREALEKLVPGDTFAVEVHASPRRPTLMADNSVIAHSGLAQQAYVELIAISSQIRFTHQSGTVVSNDGEGGVALTSPQFSGELYLEDQGAVRFTPSSALDAAVAIINHVRMHGLVEDEVLREKIASLSAKA